MIMIIIIVIMIIVIIILIIIIVVIIIIIAIVSIIVIVISIHQSVRTNDFFYFLPVMHSAFTLRQRNLLRNTTGRIFDLIMAGTVYRLRLSSTLCLFLSVRGMLLWKCCSCSATSTQSGSSFPLVFSILFFSPVQLFSLLFNLLMYISVSIEMAFFSFFCVIFN